MPEEKKTISIHKVRNHHIDAYGHVNNASYLTVVEDALVDCLEAHGIHLLEYARNGQGVYMSEVGVKYHKPAFLGDYLVVETFFKKMTRVQFFWENEIRRQSSGELLTFVKGRAAFVNEAGGVIKIPQEIKQVLSMYESE